VRAREKIGSTPFVTKFEDKMGGQSNGNQHPWWIRDEPATDPEMPRFRAVAYYRHSAQDRQENSVAIQQEQVQQQGVSRDEAIPVGDEDELRQYVFDLNCKVQCKQRDGFRRTFYSPLYPNQLRELPEP